MPSNIGKNARSPALIKTTKRYATQDREKRVKAASGKERKMEEKQKTIYDLLINDFRDYQKEWLTSHNDIEFDRPEEDLILAFLDDTADSYISEHIS